MPQVTGNPSILGPTVGINAPSAADLLAARIASISQEATAQTASSPFYVGPEGASQDLRVAGMTSDDALDAILAENTAAAAGPQAAYEEARRIDIQALKQARGEYAELGLHDLAASNSPIFKDYAARVQQQARYNAGYADTPDLPVAPMPEPVIGNGPTLYDSARHVDRQAEAELREEFTGAGRYNEIDGSEYKKELEERKQQARYDAGFTNSPDAPIEHKESLKEILGGMDMAYAVAYGGMQALGGVSKAITPMLSGDAYLADQVEEQSATSLLPLAGAIGGTLIGLRGGPAAGLAGQYIGQSAGQSLQDGIDTYMGGHTFAQERAGESLGIGRGGKEAADEFADALKNVLSPAAKELAEVFTKLGQSGPVAASGAAGLAPFQYEFGTAFAQTVGTEDRFLTSSPFLAGMRLQFGTDASSISGGDYLGAAGIAAVTGDYAAMQSNLGFAQAKAGRDVENPAYRRDRDFVDRYDRTAGFGQDIKDFFTWDGGQEEAYIYAKDRLGDFGADGEHVAGAGEAQYLSRQDTGKAKQIADSTQHLQDIFEAQQKNEADLQFSGAGVDRDTSRLKAALAAGGGAAAYQDALPGISASLTRGEGDITKEISGLRSLETLSPTLAPYYDTLIRQDEKRSADMQAEGAGLTRAGFQTSLQEEDAGFNLGITRSTLSGRSAASLQGDYRRQEAYLTGVARDSSSPLSPSERAGLEDSALKMRYQEAQAIYSEENAALGLTRAGRDAAVSRADILGSPLDAYRAGLAGLQSDRDQLAQNESELRRGNLTFAQRQDIQRQDVGLGADLAVGPERARLGAYDAEGNILSNQQSAGRALLSRDVAIGGASAYTPAIFREDEARISLYQGAEAGSPLGSAQRARFGAEAARAGAALLDDTTQSQVYRETSEQRTQDAQTEGAFRRSLIAPYLDGSPDASPFTRGTAELGLLRSRLGQAQRTLSAATDPLAREEDAGAVERYKDQIADIEQERRTGFLRALPEFIGGSPGQGSLAGVLPTPGQSAFYGGNPFVSGTFGAPDRSVIHDGSPNTAQPGGAAGAFLAGTGADSGVSALVSELKRLNDTLQHGGLGGRSPAMTGSPAGYSQNVNLQTNAYKAGGGQ